MKLNIKTKVFLKGIQKIKNVIPLKNNRLPILVHFLFEVVKDGVYLFGTDLTIGIKLFIPANVFDLGAICLPLNRLLNILKELPKDSIIEICLDKEKNLLQLKTDHSLFVIPGMVSDLFPAFPSFDEKQMTNILLEKLYDIFNLTNIAIPFEMQRLDNAPAGLLLVKKDNGIEAVGTDGHQMVYIYMKDMDLLISSPIILPKSLLNKFFKLIEWKKSKIKKKTIFSEKRINNFDTIRIGIFDNFCIFSWPNTQIFARLLENKFPDYKGPISVENDKLLIIDKDRFRQAVRRVSLITEKKEWFTLFKLSSGKLILDSESAEIGNAHDEIDIEYEGESMEIGFNSKHILDFLTVIDSPEVVLEMSDNESLAIIRPKERENIKFVIVPVRI